MATGNGILNQELKKQLAIAVRSIQWSYAIFWYNPTKQQGDLEWNDGYYNGDIKTRKTMQPMEFHVDKLGLKRSEQLKELYECLSLGDTTTNEQAKRPSASLSPEDLSDTEWYYLVCMSFTFAPGVGLPGRAFASGQHIWLCNAQYADSKLFTRSLLAKSASIQTVVCIPLLGGVIELGVTDLVTEDLTLLQHMKTVFLEFPKFICSERNIPDPHKDDDDDDGEDPVCVIDHEAFEKYSADLEYGVTDARNQVFPVSLTQDFEFDPNSLKQVQANLGEDFKADSPGGSSDESETYQQTEDSFMMEGANGGASQVQSWQFMDDDFSNCVPVSMNSSDCISQTYLNPLNKGNAYNIECDRTKFSSLDLGTNDLHYTRTLSVILGNSNHLISAPCSGDQYKTSSFAVWKKGSSVIPQKPQSGRGQKVLKNILFGVPLMHANSALKSKEGISGEDVDASHLLGEKREQLDDPFLVLRSLVPSISKLDKSSLLGDTIEYLKDLERRVEELESRGRRKSPDIAERTSDNYYESDTTNAKTPTPPVNKRKACDIDEMDPELDWDSAKDGAIAGDISVCVEEKEATIEIHVPWRESLLLEILDAMSKLELDAHSVKSSTSDGILSLSLKSKFKGAGVLAAGKIKLAIQKVVDITP